MEKMVIRNWALAEMIRGFAGAVAGSSYALQVGEVLEKLRPGDAQNLPISLSEAASLAAVVIAQVENTEKTEG